MSQGLGIIVRAYNENTYKTLNRQLKNQKGQSDVIAVLNEEVPFETKLRQSYQKAIEIGKEFTLIIDGDILVCGNFLGIVKKHINPLNKEDFGFGLKLLDKFYGNLKFRGVHVYRTNLLKKAVEFVPNEGEELRPESAVKSSMQNIGHAWRNDLSFKPVGLHDYFQRPEDIFYKQFIRATRSKDDLELLKNRYQNSKDKDFFWALEGLKTGVKFNSSFSNDKKKIIESYFPNLTEIDFFVEKPKENIFVLMATELIRNIGFKSAVKHLL